MQMATPLMSRRSTSWPLHGMTIYVHSHLTSQWLCWKFKPEDSGCNYKNNSYIELQPNRSYRIQCTQFGSKKTSLKSVNDLKKKMVLQMSNLTFSAKVKCTESKCEILLDSVWIFNSYLGSKSAIVLRESGLLSSLSIRLTMSPKRGLFERSCCQHCSMSWYTADGQSMGAGRRKASLMAFITYSQTECI